LLRGFTGVLSKLTTQKKQWDQYFHLSQRTCYFSFGSSAGAAFSTGGIGASAGFCASAAFLASLSAAFFASAAFWSAACLAATDPVSASANIIVVSARLRAGVINTDITQTHSDNLISFDLIRNIITPLLKIIIPI
jgi:hypothetical protein